MTSLPPPGGAPVLSWTVFTVSLQELRVDSGAHAPIARFLAKPDGLQGLGGE